jgi:hypothetical protein
MILNIPMKYFILIFGALILTGCEQKFRYICHDPANWDRAECKPPICKIHRDCPDMILKHNGLASIAPSSDADQADTPRIDKGACR